MAFSFGAKSPATSFGGTSSGAFGAPAAAPGGFGSSSPAGGGGSLFGNTTSLSTVGAGAAPGGLFGGPSPAPAAGGIFGSAVAPGGLFATQPSSAPLHQPPSSLSSQTPYSQLPPQVKHAIDSVHEQMMKHKRSVAQVQTMAPVLLRNPSRADVAAGASPPLREKCKDMRLALHEIESKMLACGREAMRIKSKYEQTLTQAVVFGIWPTEALASRRGIQLSHVDHKSNPTVNDEIRQSLELQAAHVDRLEKIPSPYMWQALEDMESWLQELQQKAQQVQSYLTQMQQVRDLGVASVVIVQTELLVHVAQQINVLQRHMEDLRTRYRAWEKGGNVLELQAIHDFQAKQRQDEIVRIGYLKAAAAASSVSGPTPVPPSGGVSFGSTAAVPGSLFGSTPAPVAGSSFGSTPAPATGGLFGSTTAPATGGLFGSTPAQATVALFGSTPAPATGGALGSTPAPVTGSIFGATPAPAPAGLISYTPAPVSLDCNAPAGGGAPAFGVATSGFAAATAKSKNKSRGSRRKT